MTDLAANRRANPPREDWREVLGNNIPVDFLLMHSDSELVDIHGIPLKSDRSRRPLSLDESVWKYGTCPFNDSPSRLPENQTEPNNPKLMSFFEQERLARSFPEVMGIAHHIRNSMCAENGGRPLKYLEAQRLLAAVRYSLHYLVFRAKEPIDPDQIPTSLVLTHNTALGALAGLRAGFQGDYKDDEPIPESLPAPTVDEIIQKTESKGLLVGAKTVCAASPSRIRRFCAAILGEQPERYQVPEWFNAALPPEEVPALTTFAQSMQFTEITMSGILETDETAAGDVVAEIKKDIEKLNPSALRDIIKKFYRQANECAEMVEREHVFINGGLGRRNGKFEYPLIHLGKLIMPDMTRKLHSIDPALIPIDLDPRLYAPVE